MTARTDDYLASVRAEIRARRERDRIFAGLHAADPRWAVILELEAATLAGQPHILLGTLIRDAGMTHTTGLRTIDSMIAADWLTSTRDPKGDRRRLIALAPRAMQALARYRARAGYARVRAPKSIGIEDERQIDLEEAIATALADRKTNRERHHEA